jgi:hypothetical protein
LLLTKVNDYYQTQAVERIIYLLDVILNPAKHNAGDDVKAAKHIVNKILGSAGISMQDLCKELDTYLAKQPKVMDNLAQKQMGKTLPRSFGNGASDHVRPAGFLCLKGRIDFGQGRQSIYAGCPSQTGCQVYQRVGCSEKA